jgi:hypothetical protein
MLCCIYRHTVFITVHIQKYISVYCRLCTLLNKEYIFCEADANNPKVFSHHSYHNKDSN